MTMLGFIKVSIRSNFKGKRYQRKDETLEIVKVASMTNDHVRIHKSLNKIKF